MEMRKTEVRMNKPIYLGQSKLDLSKILMFGFWYDYLKPKYGDKIKLCYMDTDSFVLLIKTDFYKDISNDVNRWFDTSNFNRNDKRPLETGKNRKVIAKFKDELVGKMLTEFCAFRAKAYSFLIDEYTDVDYEKNKIVNKKTKGTKKCIVKREIIFKNYVDSLFQNQVLLRAQHRFRSDHHKVYTEEVNKIALSSNDDKRIQTFDKVTTYPYGANAFMVRKNEMLLKNKFIDMVKKSDSLILRNNSEILRREAETIRNDSLQVGNEVHNLIDEAEEIRISSEVLRRESRALTNLLFTDKDFTKKDMVINCLEDTFDTSHLFGGIVVDNDLDMLLFDDVDKTDNDLDTDNEFIERDRLGIDRAKPDSKKKPETMKDKHDIEIVQPDIEIDEPVTEIDEPDTFKKVECISSNDIIYEIRNIPKYKGVLLKIINERLAIFEDIDFELSKILDNSDILKHQSEFNKLCKAARIKNTTKPMMKISILQKN